MRALHLPGKAIFGYSRDDLEDICQYFKPDVTLVSSLRYQRKEIEKNSAYETIYLDSISGPLERDLGDETLIFLRDSASIKNLDIKNTSNTEITVITDQIEKKMDMSMGGFDFELTNTSIIDDLNNTYGSDQFSVLSTEIEAGKKIEYKNHFIYGFGPNIGIEGMKIPNVITGKRPQIETLEASKVGLSAVPGLGDRFSTELRNRGIETRKDLCDLEPKDILDQEGIGSYRSTKWICSAKALEEEDVYRIDSNDLKNKHRIFIDIETDSLKPRIIWHIGIYDDKQGEYKSFLEKNPDKKGRIIKKFLDYLKANAEENSVLLAWYGSQFDFEHLENFIDKYHSNRMSVWDSIEKVDFMYWADKHAALPCRNSKLFHVAERLGYESELMGLDGEEVARIYNKYVEDRNNEPDWEELKTYAKDDVISMKHVYEKIKEAPVLHDKKEVEKEYRKR